MREPRERKRGDDIIRRETDRSIQPMMSGENGVILSFGLLAVLLFVSLSRVASVPTWTTIAVLLVVGVLLPQLLARSVE